MHTETHYRMGQVAPNSSTTIGTEFPAMFHAREGVEPELFTAHIRKALGNLDSCELGTLLSGHYSRG